MNYDYILSFWPATSQRGSKSRRKMTAILHSLQFRKSRLWTSATRTWRRSLTRAAAPSSWSASSARSSTSRRSTSSGITRTGCSTTTRSAEASGRCQGRGCSTAVEHALHVREVVGLIPAVCWAFFHLLSSVIKSLNRSLEEVQHYCFFSTKKNKCLVVQLEAKQT